MRTARCSPSGPVLAVDGAERLTANCTMKSLINWARAVAGPSLQYVFRRLGYDIVPTQPKPPEFPPDFDTRTADIARAVKPYTMTMPERIYALCEAVRYLHRNDIGGAIVECGVWRGGSIMAAAKTLLDLGVTDRDLYLFDTFEGMTPPTEHDVDLNGNPATAFFNDTDHTAPDGGLGFSLVVPSSLEEVRASVTSTGYPMEHVFFVVGKVEDTIPASAPADIALLRLDTDWYTSTRHELEYLYPRIRSGGVLIIDDYGHWRGSRQAVDEYVAQNAVPILLNRIDYSGRIAVVP